MKPTYANGPSGGSGGGQFLDNITDERIRLKEIRIRSGNKVDSIQSVYEVASGNVIQGDSHGGAGGGLNVITFDDDEYLVAVVGTSSNVVDSVSFQTNKRQTETYGGTAGVVGFAYRSPAGTEIIGFTGRCGERVDALGVLMRDH